jgi:hypothetical protein
MLEALRPHAKQQSGNWLSRDYKLQEIVTTERNGVKFSKDAMKNNMYSESVKKDIEEFFSPRIENVSKLLAFASNK